MGHWGAVVASIKQYLLLLLVLSHYDREERKLVNTKLPRFAIRGL